MTRDFRIGSHVIRLVTTAVDYGSGCYRPGIRLFLSGPNGSPAGTGPKAWPLHMALRSFRSRHSSLWFGWHKRYGFVPTWTNCLYLPVPHIRWSTAYRLRRIGALSLYRADYRLNTRLFAKQAR